MKIVANLFFANPNEAVLKSFKFIIFLGVVFFGHLLGRLVTG